MSRLLLGGGGHSKPEPAAFIGEIRKFLGPIDRILFVPYALKDYDAYAKWMMELGYHAGYGFESIHKHKDPREAVLDAQAVYVGGGNTFRLLTTLEENDLLPVIRERVLAGMPFIGVSAGSNVACPTIKTTNDMPIVQPKSFHALGLVPFQINPHYVDRDPNSTHQGETREDRIREFHEMNDAPVVGLREGGILRVENHSILLCGTAGARIFQKGKEQAVYAPGDNLDFLWR
jgi:dipeptidase E